MDETLALPSRKAAEIALRTQQLIAFETGAANVADPLGGSWFVEELTDKLEKEAEKYFIQLKKWAVLFRPSKRDFSSGKLLMLHLNTSVRWIRNNV
jgi:methylmalonyl-CoA mutase N-terminal domain/subunit